MKVKTWLLLGGLVFAVFGIAMVAVPNWMGTTFGMDLNESGVLLTRLFGAAFIFASIASYRAASSAPTEPAVRGVVLASLVGNLVGFAFALMGTLAGTMNGMGWLVTALYGVFGLIFVYFFFAKPS